MCHVRATGLSLLSGFLGLAVCLYANAADNTAPLPEIASQGLSALEGNNCPVQLDAAVALASNEQDENGYLDARFAQLELLCPDWPQIAHNRGVLAARAERWPEAIEHFNRSLSLDARASMSHRHLQLIFEHRAAVSYARALKTPLPKGTPSLFFQTAADQNARSVAIEPNQRQYRTISTIEYELYAWWKSKDTELGNREFYAQEFPVDAIGLGIRKYATSQWIDLQREISFTEKDAVVILSDINQNRTLLLLKLAGTRWKIYQETAL